METANVPAIRRQKSAGKGYMLLVVLFVLTLTIGGTFLGLFFLKGDKFFPSSVNSKNSDDSCKNTADANNNENNSAITNNNNINNNSVNNNSVTNSTNNNLENSSTNNNISNEDGTTFVEKTINLLSVNSRANLVIPQDQEDTLIQQLSEELQKDARDPLRLKAYIILIRKASSHLSHSDNNKHRSSILDSLGKLANILLIHLELEIKEPILPLRKLTTDSDDVYLDPVILGRIKAVKGEAGLRFLKALRVYVLSLSIEKVNIQDRDKVAQLSGIINDIKRYISETYD